MSNLSLTAAVLALIAAANISSAKAQPTPSGDSACPGISQGADPGTSNATTATAHYEYQYGYDHHSKWRGRWVLVR